MHPTLTLTMGTITTARGSAMGGAAHRLCTRMSVVIITMQTGGRAGGTAAGTEKGTLAATTTARLITIRMTGGRQVCQTSMKIVQGPVKVRQVVAEASGAPTRCWQRCAALTQHQHCKRVLRAVTVLFFKHEEIPFVAFTACFRL